jgi:hypothetical protein
MRVGWAGGFRIDLAPRASVAATLAVCFLLPLLLSFGTDMPVLAHSKLNAVFAWMPLLALVYGAYLHGALSPRWLTCALLVLCVPSLALQVLPLYDATRSYRQFQPMLAQSVPVTVGQPGGPVLVDAQTAHSITSVQQAAAAVGWKPGSLVLNLAGDGPGWTYALGGRPVGQVWLLGGYRGSNLVVDQVLSALPEAQLRSAWVISSSTNPRRIEGWRPQPVETIDVELWKPVTP